MEEFIIVSVASGLGGLILSWPIRWIGRRLSRPRRRVVEDRVAGLTRYQEMKRRKGV